MVNVGAVNANAGMTVNPSGFAAYSAALQAAGNNATNFSNTARSAFSGVTVGLTAAVIGTAAAGVSLASSFQDAGTTLTTLYGNADIAKEKFQWMTNFAAQTPFEFKEIEEGGIKLKAYGMDIEKYGKTFGDTAAGMGKSFNDVIEAVADAQTGEFERLKELGIKAVQVTKQNLDQYAQYGGKVGDTMLTYVDRSGKQMAQAVDRNNREMVTSTINAIWNEKYAGAMETRSKTLSGLTSTLKDNLSMGLASLAGYDMKNMEVASFSLLGVLQSLAGVAVDFTSGLSTISPEARIFITVIGAGVVAVGAITSAMMVWTAVSGLAVTANMTLGASLAAAFWPVTGVIALIALLAVGLYELNEKTGIVSASWDFLKDVFTIVVDYLKSAASDLSSWITTEINKITEAFRNIIPQSVIDDVTKFYNWASDLIGKVTGAVKGKADAINAKNAVGTPSSSPVPDVATPKAAAQVNTMSSFLDILNGKTDQATQKMNGLNNVSLGSVTGQVDNLGTQTDSAGQKVSDLNIKLNETGSVNINGTTGQLAAMDSQGRTTNMTLNDVLSSLTKDGNVSMGGTVQQIAIIDSQGKATAVTTEQLSAMLKQAGSVSMGGTVSGIQSIASAWNAARTAASQYASMQISIGKANKSVGQSYGTSTNSLGSVSPEGVRVLSAGQSVVSSSVTVNNTYNSPVASDHKAQLAITKAG